MLFAFSFCVTELHAAPQNAVDTPSSLPEPRPIVLSPSVSASFPALSHWPHAGASCTDLKTLNAQDDVKN